MSTKMKCLCVAVGVLLAAVARAPAQPAGIQFTSITYSVGETDGMVFITVELTDADPFSVYLVDYATMDGTAIAGVDYSHTAGNLTFAPFEDEEVIGTSTYSDTFAEISRAFTVALRNPTGGALLGHYRTQQVRIRDNGLRAGGFWRRTPYVRQDLRA